MKLINKYITLELVKSFFMGLIVFSFILLLNSIFQFIDMLVTKYVSVFTVGKLLFYTVLTLVSITVPISLLFSVILTYGRMSEDNEITVLRSSGVNTLKFIWQPLFIGLLAAVFLLWMNTEILPKVQKRFQVIYTTIAKTKPVIKFEPKTFTTVGEYKVYVNETDKLRNRLINVNIYKPLELSIFAKYGIAKYIPGKGVKFDLYDGTIHYGTFDNISKISYSKFRNYVTLIPIPEDDTVTVTKTLREFTSKELQSEIQNYKKHNIPATFMETEYYLRWSLSFSAIALIFCGIPVSILLRKGSKSVGLGVCLLIIGVFYFLLITGVTTAEKGRFAAKYIIWLPNIAMLLAGTWFNYRLFRK